jgi:hypothetical protein
MFAGIATVSEYEMVDTIPATFDRALLTITITINIATFVMFQLPSQRTPDLAARKPVELQPGGKTIGKPENLAVEPGKPYRLKRTTGRQTGNRGRITPDILLLIHKKHWDLKAGTSAEIYLNSKP